MALKLKDPIKSIRQRIRNSTQGKNPYFRGKPGPINNNPHGIGALLPGEKSRNPTGKGGFGDNPPMHVLIARAKSCAKRGEKLREKKLMNKKRRTSESESIVKDAREIQELARKHVPKAIEKLGEILENPEATDMSKIAAYHALADRGYGKPTQTNLNANFDADSKPSEVNEKELDSRIAEALERIERITSGTGQEVSGKERPADIRKYN